MKILISFIAVLVFSKTFAQSSTITVAADGSGKFKTVQEAFDAVPASNKTPVIIYVRNGVYKEKLHLDPGKDNVTLKGEDKL